jgi:sugar lactone lactonase YvrE
MEMEESPMASGKETDRDRRRSASGTVVWLRKALVAVVCAVLGHVPVHVLVALVVCLTAALVLASSKNAYAAPPSLIPDGQFESAGALGVTVDNSAEASDPARGDVYAAGFLNILVKSPVETEFIPGRINKFDSSGNPLSPPSPFGEAFADGGIAVNPANGNVYTLNALSSEIETYDSTTGALMPPPFPVAASHNYLQPFLGNPTVVGIAADSAGDVYVPQPRREDPVSSGTFVSNDEVHEYSSAGALLKTFTDGVGSNALKEPTGVAVDASGNLWIADTGNNRIVELNPAGAPVEVNGKPVEIASEGVQSIAVDAHGDVFAILDNSRDFCGLVKAPCSHLVEYDPARAQVGDFGAGVIGAKQFGPETGAGRNHEPVPDMVAVSDATGEVYVSEAVATVTAGVSSGQVWEYRPPAAPVVEGEGKDELAVEVSASTAKLGAIVSPGGASASYRFEYGTTPSYGNSVPFPEGDAGAGFASRTVWAGVSGLSSDTTYHYRVVVTGEVGGTIVGEDHTFKTSTTAACPNDAFRTGFSANLPDCRAYELVMPSAKDGAQPDINEGGNGRGELELGKTLADNRAAADAEGNGESLAFHAEDVSPGSPSAGEDYVATRGAGGWSAQNLFPPTDYYGYKCPDKLRRAVYSEDLSKAIVKLESAGQLCGVDPELVSGEPHGVENYFIRDNSTGAYQLVDAPEKDVVGFVPATPSLLGESPDLSRIVFSEEAILTKDAPAGAHDVYEWSGGHVALVTVLPDGTPVAGSYVGVSADGSRVFFTAEGNLYARVDGRETVRLDESQASGAGGGGTFVEASHDGSVVLFTDGDAARLTTDTVPGSGTNLYRYDAAAPAGQRLTDLTPVAKAETPAVGGMSRDGSVVFFTDGDAARLTADTVPGSGANLYRYEAGGSGVTDLTPVSPAEAQSVVGVSEDGSSVYFTAEGELTPVPNQHGEKAHSGQSNMYLSRGGANTFIAPGGGGTMSANGGFLLFGSTASLTGYDNLDPSTGADADEFYLYDAARNSLACASCNPSGAPPTPFAIRPPGGLTFAGGPDEDEGQEKREPSPRQLTDKGQVFFDSAEELLPADTNGQAGCPSESGFPRCTDVYEFEPEGVGRPACSEPAGCLSLLSTGTGSLETFFIDASLSGNDVFIREFQKLVPSDTEEGAPSIYDVRENGGFSKPVTSPCTTPEGCRGAPTTPQPTLFGAPASQTFSGVGNLAPPPPGGKTAVKPKKKTAVKPKKCRKGFVKKKGKCVKAKTATKKSAHVNRTGK